MDNLVQESQAQQLLKGALVKLASLESDSYLLVCASKQASCKPHSSHLSQEDTHITI